MEKIEVYSSGIGFSGLLIITFIVLKLCNIIDWSWWWVLSPLWIPLAMCIIIVILMSALVAIFSNTINNRW